MSLLGRDARQFRYVEGGMGADLPGRVRRTLVDLDPASNPYVQWIATGRHLGALPHALRAENFEIIRDHLDRLEWHCASVDEFLAGASARSIHRFNLSDVFEYVSPESYERTLRRILRVGCPSGRLAYWNMLVTRQRPDCLAPVLRPLDTVASRLHGEDRVPFYRALRIEELTTWSTGVRTWR
jgi:S-adenosylmethionine-diacylglycerol 3-amino-3-carboxypropyl transferase